MSTDLAAFVAARLDEDEAAAREACDGDSGEWFMGDKWNIYRAEDESRHFPETAAGPDHQLVAWGNIKPQSEHIARRDPARALRALRAIAAKRQTLDLCRRVINDDDGRGYWSDGWAGLGVAKIVLAALAAEWSDHPDYDPAWAPKP